MASFSCKTTADLTAAVRLPSTTAEALKNYFELLTNVLEENGLMDKPAQLYNMNETGMPQRAPNILL